MFKLVAVTCLRDNRYNHFRIALLLNKDIEYILIDTTNWEIQTNTCTHHQPRIEFNLTVLIKFKV